MGKRETEMRLTAALGLAFIMMISTLSGFVVTQGRPQTTVEFSGYT